MIDIDALSRPISDDEPAGPDLEYTSVAELERFAAGTPGTIDPSTQELVGAEEPKRPRPSARRVHGPSSTRTCRKINPARVGGMTGHLAEHEHAVAAA